MLTIHQLPPAFGLPISASPFCTKLEAYLRLTERPYQTADSSPQRSPSRQVPFVTGLPERNGEPLADTGIIIATLEERGPTLDADLDPESALQSTELLALAEHELYHANLYTRFGEDTGWALQKAMLKSALPKLMAPVLLPIIRISQVKRCQEAGMTDDEAYRRGNYALERISQALEDKPYVLGDKAHVVDCSVWANLTHAAHCPSANPLRDTVRRNAKLVAYIDRFARAIRLQLPALPESP